MSACVHCHQRKGKRRCPALEGMICSQCCGKHRLKEIDCPADCGWLGGLAVVRDPARATAGFTRDDYASVLDKLIAFSRPFREDAFSWFFGDAEPQEWELGPGVAYLCYGKRDADGQRVVDRFLVARGRDLPVAEVAAVVALQRAWASLFEVTEVRAGVGLELRDLLSGETLEVREVSATATVRRWDVLFAWVMAFPDHLELTGAAFQVPRPHLDAVRAALEDALERHRGRRKGAADRELVGEIAWVPVHALRLVLQGARMPELRTMHDEELLLCQAHYSVRDEPAVRERLAAIPNLDALEGDYTWVDDQGHPAMAGGPISLGQIRVSRDALVLETMSRERLERGKALLDGALGDAAAHRADSIQAPEAALRERERRAPERPRSDEIPEDVQRQVIGQYLQEHYQRWIDDPLPALAGKTPRKAVRTRAGRARVIALLKDIENGTLGMPGGDAVDFAVIRRELGLEGGEAPPQMPDYDASRQPDPRTWLEAGDADKARAALDHHRALGVEDVPEPQLHALMHVIVENQLASGEPPAVRAAMTRLLAAGVTRHAAIHAIGSVMAEGIWNVARDQAAFDLDAAARALARLRPDDWITRAP